MRALRIILRFVAAAAGFLLLVVIISLVCYRAGLNARCRIGNMGGPFTSDNVQAEHDLGVDWARRALTCDMGEYQVVTPIDRSRSKGGYILRNGHMFLLVGEKGTAVHDDSGKRLLFAFTSATPERSATISYSAYDRTKGAWIENFDLDANGTLDYRTTEIDGRPIKHEYRIGEQWLEGVGRDNRYGVVVNGQFMPIADAIKLANPTARK